jgi:outer membrane receptor for ferrienterochelin and colicin
MTLLRGIFSVFLLFTYTLVHASEPSNSEDFLDLSLLDLISIKVTVASKISEDFLDAPGVVSVINRKQIESYGAKTVGEIIERFPGVMKNNLYSIPESHMSLRGQTSKGTDNRMLLMINGRPLRDYYAGGINNHIYQGMSVSAIDHIEMIRGPGSVLYGSSAFVGVINIVTRKDLSDGETDVSFTVGSFDTQITELNYSLFNHDQISAQTSLRINQVGGWDYKYTDAFSVSDSLDNGYDAYSLISTLKMGDYGLDVFYNHIETNTIGADSLWPRVADANERGFMNAYLEKSINDHWRMRADITYNTISNEHIDTYAGLDLTTYNIIYEAALHGSYDRWTYLLGSSINTLNANDKLNSSKVDTQWNNVYGQAIFDVRHNLNFIFGLQVNQTENVDSDTSPRVGLVYHFSPQVGSKILYNEAFRAPSWTETETSEIPNVLSVILN